MQLLTIYDSSGLNMGSFKGPTWQGSRCREATSPNRLVPRQGAASHRGRRAIVKDSGPASHTLPCLHSWPSFSIWGPPYGDLRGLPQLPLPRPRRRGVGPSKTLSLLSLTTQCCLSASSPPAFHSAPSPTKLQEPSVLMQLTLTLCHPLGKMEWGRGEGAFSSLTSC